MKHINLRSVLMMVVMCLPLFLQAQKVNEEAARQKAREFFMQQSKSESQSSRRKVAAQKAQAELRLASDEDAFYVFNVGKQDGFVIVSGDERAVPVLGYSDSGKYDTANIPEGLKDMLNQYKSEIEYLQSHTDVASAPRKTEERKAIEPLLKTKWGQGEPYNGMTPLFGKSGHCVTGCVATAMAQVMKYHRYPEHGYGNKSYEWTWLEFDNQLKHTETLSADLSQSYYDWDNMMDDYNYSTNITGKSVALLMRDCGYSVDMAYGDASWGSGAAMSAVAPALKQYFGFSSQTIQIFRSSFTTEDWKTILYKELVANRPIIYAGSNYDVYTYNPDSHAFVCDGYMDDYFHFNFGWDGAYDGYYLIDAIQMNWITNEYGYNIDQDAILCYPYEIQDAFSFSDYQLTVNHSLKVINIEKPEYYYKDHAFTVKATIKNDGDGEYHGAVLLYNGDAVVEYDEVNHIAAYKKLDMKAGEVKDIEFEYEGIPSDRMNSSSLISNSFFVCERPTWQPISDVFTIEAKSAEAPFCANGIYYLLHNEGDYAIVKKPANGYYSGNVHVPKNVEFEGRSIPVKRVGDYAFLTGSSQIESVTIPSSIESFGNMPFGNCMKIILDITNPISYTDHLLFNYPRQISLYVPVGSGSLYANDPQWGKVMKLYEGENIVMDKMEFFYWIHGAAEITINGQRYTGAGSTLINANSDVNVHVTPKFDNEVVKVGTYPDLNITSSDFTLRPKKDEYDNIHVYVGFVKNGLTFSIINDEEVVLLSTNYNNEVEIPESVEYNGTVYSVGCIDEFSLEFVKVLTVPWTEPIDISKNVFAENLSSFTLNVPKGSAEAYINHPVWGMASKIVENGVVVKENIEIKATPIVSGVSPIVIGGNSYMYSSYVSQRGEDVTFTIKPSYPLLSVSLCYINGVDILDSLDETNSYTIKNVQEPMEIKYLCGYFYNGIWYDFGGTQMVITNRYNDNGTYQYSDSICEYWAPRVTAGKYSGHLVVPSEITIPEYKTEYCHVIGKTQSVSFFSLLGSDCDGLISIELPSSISTIPNYYSSLYDNHYKYLIVHWDDPITVDSVAFLPVNGDRYVFENVTLIVPSGTIDKYKKHPTWGLFKNIVEGDGSYHYVNYTIDGKPYKSYELFTGQKVTPENMPTKEGYTFSGWSDIPSTMPANDITINGSFFVNIYKVIYKVGDSVVKEYEVAYGDDIPSFVYESLEDRYSFQGWDGEVYDKMPAHDIVYTAIIADGIDSLSTSTSCTVYTITGIKVASDIPFTELKKQLPVGTYIVNGKKIVIRK